MRCNKGDLAIIVSSSNPNSPNIGKIVRCIRFVGELSHRTSKIKDYWEVDQELEFYYPDGACANKDWFSVDSYMIPLNHKLEDISEESVARQQIKELINE